MKYYMMNKPKGCITAHRDEKHKTVMEYFQEEIPGLHPVGRLDKDTEGLLLLTDDGQWTQELMHPENHVDKTYFFWAMGEITQENIEKIQQGIEMRGGKARPAEIQIVKKDILENVIDIASGIHRQNRKNQPVYAGYLTISEGKKHQVKRMIKAAGGFVIYLKRVTIGGLQLDATLRPGEYRELTEVERLQCMEKKKEIC